MLDRDVSLPSASSITIGRFSTAPMPRIATCGWLMIGVPKSEPKTPGLVIVNVPPCDLLRLELLGACAIGEVVGGLGEAEQVHRVGVLDHRHDQPPIERHRHAEVDVLLEHDVGAVDRRVELGIRLEPAATALKMNGM